MRALRDTHLLLWAPGAPERLPAPARAFLEDPASEPLFSAASLWEVALLTVDPVLRRYPGPVRLI